MNRVSLLLMLALVALPGCGPSPTSAPAAAPPREAAAPAPPPGPAWDPHNQRLALTPTGDVPAQFRGIAGEPFLKNLYQAAGVAQKKDYESRAEQAARVAEELPAALAPLEIGVDYPFVLPSVRMTYDAEREVAHLAAYLRLMAREGPTGTERVMLSLWSHDEGTYTGSNAFGASREVRRE